MQPGGHLLRTSEGHKETVRALVIRPDGKMAVSADWGDKTLKLWNLITGKLLNTLGSHRVWKNAVAVNQDGKTAVSSSLDKTLKIWDLGTEIVLNSLEGHRKGVTSVALSPDGKTIVSGSFDKAIIVWDLGSGQKLAAFLSEYIIKSVAFAPCARILIAGEGCGRISSFEIIGLSIGVFMYSGGMKMISFIEDEQLVKKFSSTWTYV